MHIIFALGERIIVPAGAKVLDTLILSEVKFVTLCNCKNCPDSDSVLAYVFVYQSDC